MNMIKEMLVEERDRNHEMQRIYRSEIDKLPRGTVVIKKSGKQDYCYLQYREKEKVISQYVGRADEHASRLQAQIAERRELQRLLRRLQNEERYLEKVLRLND